MSTRSRKKSRRPSARSGGPDGERVSTPVERTDREEPIEAFGTLGEGVRTVPVGRFHYRHEAEFAAGFLRDAGIAYRLQSDDAGGAGLGLSFVRPAVIWVRDMDAKEARDLIAADEGASEAERRTSTRTGRTGARRPARVERRGRLSRSPSATGRGGGRTLAGRSRSFDTMERVVSGVLSVTFFATAGVLPTMPYGSLLTVGCVLLGIGFSIGAAIGRAGPLDSFVKMLSGSPP